MKKNEEKMYLPKIATLDDFFSTQEERDNQDKEYVEQISIKDIDDFEGHPFSVNDDELMKHIVECINEGKYVPPAIIRKKENGRYEMVVGHRRKRAFTLANKKEMPCIVKDLDHDEATILMVNTNIDQREKILISEKAFAYKMRLEAMKRQGKRTDLTSCQVGTKLRSDESLASELNESARQVQRYIRLTELIKELLDLVDIEKISFNPAVEISFIDKENQYILLDCINKYSATPSQAQAIHLKKLSQEGKLTASKIEEIISQEKSNQMLKYKINYNRFERYLPKEIATPKEVEDFLLKCVEEHYHRQKLKKRENER